MTPRYGILAALVLGLSVRLAPWSRVFAGGQAAFVDTDDYYHLRRMMVAAANFPALPAFDRYLGHPEGFFVNWPPLYDWVGGLFLRILVGATPDLYRSQIILAWIAPLCGLLTLWLFYRAVRPLLGPRPALTALFIAAVMPMQVFYTLLGRPDHHSVENLWFLLAVPLSLRLVRAEDPGLSRKLASWTGALLAAGTLCWIGDVMFSLILFIFLAGETLLSGRKASPGLRWAPLIFFILVQLFLAAGILKHWYAIRTVAFDAPSPFQPLLMVVLGLCLLGLRSPRYLLTGAALAVLLAAASRLSFAEFSALPRPFESFSELRPLSFALALKYFGCAALALPLLAVWLAIKERTETARLLLIWLLLTAVLALRQTRYAYHLSLPAAALLGWGAWAAIEALERRWPRREVAARAAVAVLAALLAWPAATYLRAQLSAADIVSDPRLLDVCRWIRENTPPTRSLWRDEGRPEYGVFALHNIGIELAALAQRPALAGNWHLQRAKVLESASFFFITEENEAYRFLLERGFRYIVLDDMVSTGALATYARQLGLSQYKAEITGPGRMTLSKNFQDLLYMRLYFGAAGETKHFRRLYETQSRAGGPGYKVFELKARPSAPSMP